MRAPFLGAAVAALALAGAPKTASADPLVPPPRPEQTPPSRVRFIADPVADGAILSAALGFGLLSQAILETGEIVPQQPVSPDILLPIDRGIVRRRFSTTATDVSNVGIGAAIAFAALDPIFTTLAHGSEAGIVDAILYAESIAVTFALTNLAKIAVRRPRPIAYQEFETLQREYEAGGSVGDPPRITETDTSLSFFSGHAAVTATIVGTGAYLAVARTRSLNKPLLVLGAGALLTTAVAMGRVYSGKHFPTDVIAGAMAGLGVGLLVPHIHREAPASRRRVWIGTGPCGPAGLSLQGQFD